MTNLTTFTVDGANFKRFWEDTTVWASGDFLEDAIFVIDGNQVSSENIDVATIKDDSQVGIHCGDVYFEDEKPKGHVFTGLAEGKLQSMLLAWCKREGLRPPSENDKDLVWIGKASIQDVLDWMGTHAASGRAVQSTLSPEAVGALAKRFQGVVDELVAIQSEQESSALKTEIDK